MANTTKRTKTKTNKTPPYKKKFSGSSIFNRRGLIIVTVLALIGVIVLAVSKAATPATGKLSKTGQLYGVTNKLPTTLRSGY